MASLIAIGIGIGIFLLFFKIGYTHSKYKNKRLKKRLQDSYIKWDE